MTIYTPTATDKKVDKEQIDPEVVSKPFLASLKYEEEDDVEVAPKLVRITYFPRSRRSFFIHLLLTLMVLVIIACGAIGAVVFYRHLHKKEVYSGKCGNVYFDSAYHEKPQPVWSGNSHNAEQLDFFEERIEVSLDEMYESLYTPRFDEVRETYVWHDFHKNYTALIEHNWKMCYVMKLNRTLIAPPKDLVDLMNKVMTGYYLPKARVLRENYRMVVPPLSDLSQFGHGISTKCQSYQTFWLMKYSEDDRKKRSVDEDEEKLVTYALLSNHMGDQTIMKVQVHNKE